MGEDIRHAENSSVMQPNNPDTSVNYEDLIAYSNDFIEDDIPIYICDAWFLICVLSNANFNVPYLSLGK